MTYQGQGAPGRSRTGLWVALGCAGLVVVLLLLAVTAGVILLVSDRGGGQAATSTAPEAEPFEHELFTLEYPAHWENVELTAEDGDAGMVLNLRTEGRIVGDDEVLRDEFTAYVFTSDVHAVAECRLQANFLGMGWDDSADPEDVGPADVDGREAAHHRVTGTMAGVDASAETWCVDVGDQIVQISADAYETTELTEEIRSILDSWRWADSA